jgi:hypothetical protein
MMAQNPRWKIRAAEQMERDGIRRLSAGEIGPGSRCAHRGDDSFGFVTGCKNTARYHVSGEGVRCFSHAIAFAGRAEQVSA